MASPVTGSPARCQRESAETNDVADQIVSYVIDEARIMYDRMDVYIYINIYIYSVYIYIYICIYIYSIYPSLNEQLVK